MLSLLSRFPLFLLLVAFLPWAGPVYAGTPQVVTSLKPLELLVRAVADEQVEVTTLVPAGASPHTYQLRPSERRRLASANLVFWVGPGMETFLTRLLTGPDFRSRTVALATPGDEDEQDERDHTEHDGDGAHHEDEALHDDEHEHETGSHAEAGHDHAHNHGDGEDPHIWLDPALALNMTRQIAEHLKALDGVDAAAIDRNLNRFKEELATREASIRRQLAPAQRLDLFTYHEAFGRFAEHYGLKVAGVLTLSPERNPGARHLAEVQQRLQEAPTPCLMTEPQFNRQWWRSLMGDTQVPISVWDPLASDIESSAQGYLDFQQSLADAVLDCLPEQAQQ